VVQYQKKPTKHPKCAATGVVLHGVSARGGAGRAAALCGVVYRAASRLWKEVATRPAGSRAADGALGRGEAPTARRQHALARAPRRWATSPWPVSA
jgi:hypothetical protein